MLKTKSLKVYKYAPINKKILSNIILPIVLSFEEIIISYFYFLSDKKNKNLYSAVLVVRG